MEKSEADLSSTCNVVVAGTKCWDVLIAGAMDWDVLVAGATNWGVIVFCI